jgi:hypothetical protein
MRFRKWRAVGAASAVALVAAWLTGCGASGAPMPNGEALVRSADISRVSRDSPAGVVLRLWRSVQVGDAASSASYYDPRVLNRIGFVEVSGTLAQQRSNLEVFRPKVVSDSQTPIGRQIIVKADNKVGGTRQNPVAVFSFVLRSSPEGWRVAYDTLLGDALPSYVQAKVQQQVAPGSQTPSPKAQIAGLRAGDEYRSLFSDVLQRNPGRAQGKR